MFLCCSIYIYGSDKIGIFFLNSQQLICHRYGCKLQLDWLLQAYNSEAVILVFFSILIYSFLSKLKGHRGYEEGSWANRFKDGSG